jgi:hypothetical protein
MKIYIASSWKNQHAVELLTEQLRSAGHQVKSFVEHEGQRDVYGKVPFEEWIESVDGRDCFEYDTSGATDSELVIYVGPSGIDAWAEVGAAWARGVPLVGLWAKGENVGLMRRMISSWFLNHRALFAWLKTWAPMVEAAKRPIVSADQKCEGCEKTATTADSERVPLCSECAKSLEEEDGD